MVLGLPSTSFSSAAPLVIPANVCVMGALGKSVDDCPARLDPRQPALYLRASSTRAGRELDPHARRYNSLKVGFPAAGKWSVLTALRNRNDRLQPAGRLEAHGMLAVDGGPAVPLDNLPDTGTLGAIKVEPVSDNQSDCRPARTGAGRTRRAAVSTWMPSSSRSIRTHTNDNPPPECNAQTVVLQGEDVVQDRDERRQAAGRRPGRGVVGWR